MLRRLIDKAFGVPTRMTDYRPSVPDGMTNIGAAYWTLEATEREVRIFARRLPPRPILILAGAIPSCVVIGVVVTLALVSRGSPWHKAAIAIGSLAGTFALGGIWFTLLLGNRQEAQEADLLVYKRASNFLELPRTRARILVQELERVELASFWIGGSGENLYCRHLVLVAKPSDGQELFHVLLERGAPMRRLGTQLAGALDVPMVIAHCGTYDVNKKSWG